MIETFGAWHIFMQKVSWKHLKDFLLGFERLFLSDFVLWKLDNAIFWVINFTVRKINIKISRNSSIRKWSIMVVKLIRAHSGCLGIRRRWRTRQTAICFGEQQVCFDPEISEWGNSLASASILEWIHSSREVNPVNWNILVAGGKERKIDYLSSGERNGNSPN